jgi:hypothetical protein
MSGKREDREERYRRNKAAEDEVLRRLTLAVDRLRVVAEFGDAGSSGVVAQTLHAVHFLERGWAGAQDSRTLPRDAPDFRISHEEAEDLATGLAGMLMLARNATYTAGEADRA